MRSSSVCAGLSLIAVSIMVAACDHKTDTSDCFMMVPGIRIPTTSIDISITNRYGRGIAIGATVSATSAGQVLQPGFYTLDGDTLHVFRGGDQAGTFDVAVSKPFYRDTTISRVVVNPLNQCGSVVTTKLPVTLQLAAGAPPIRSLAVLGSSFFSTAGSQKSFVPYFDADPGAPLGVTWRLTDTLLARVDASGVVMSRCTVRGGADTLIATSVADPTVSGRTQFGVGPLATCP